MTYSFDEFLNNHIGNMLIERVYEVFDNHSVLVHLTNNKTGSMQDNILVIQKKRDSTWEITGIEGMIITDSFSASIDKSSFRIERISSEGIQIPIPHL